MFINYEMATIEITKAEAKEAGVFKSEMYENLKEQLVKGIHRHGENIGY